LTQAGVSVGDADRGPVDECQGGLAKTQWRCCVRAL